MLSLCLSVIEGTVKKNLEIWLRIKDPEIIVDILRQTRGGYSFLFLEIKVTLRNEDCISCIVISYLARHSNYAVRFRKANKDAAVSPFLFSTSTFTRSSLRSSSTAICDSFKRAQ